MKARDYIIVAAVVGYVIIGVSIFRGAFRHEVTKTRVEKVDLAAGYFLAKTAEAPLTGEFYAHCEYRENRHGIVAGTVKPSIRDRIVITCEARSITDLGGPKS